MFSLFLIYLICIKDILNLKRMVYKEIEYLEFIIKWLVLNSDSVNIKRSEDELGVLLTLSVSKEDMWSIIWKSWNTIKSIRSIIRLYGVRLGKKINLKVLD